MDLNYLLRREQIERVRALTAETGEARRAHSELADHYRARIEACRPRPAAAQPRPAARLFVQG